MLRISKASLFFFILFNFIVSLGFQEDDTVAIGNNGIDSVNALNIATENRGKSVIFYLAIV